MSTDMDTPLWVPKDPDGNLAYELLEGESYALCFVSDVASRQFIAENLFKKLIEAGDSKNREPVAIIDLSIHEMTLSQVIAMVIHDTLAYWVAVELTKRPEFSEPSNIIVYDVDQEVVDVIGVEPLNIG